MQFNGYERRAIAMRTESCARKTFLGLQALLFLVFYAGAGSLYIIQDKVHPSTKMVVEAGNLVHVG